MPKAPPLTDNQIHSFWSRVEVGPPDACWEWQGGYYPNGYGRVKFNRLTYSVHRLAYWLGAGENICGFVIRHTCDNPPCCNPSHLIKGNQKANMVDKVNKHRQARGEEHGQAVLTWKKVQKMRTLRPTMSLKALAQLFGISVATAHQVCTHTTWKENKHAEST